MIVPAQEAHTPLQRLFAADLVDVTDELRVLICKSKTEQEGQGQEIAIPRSSGLQPVEAVQTWPQAAEILIRAVALGGLLSDVALAESGASVFKLAQVSRHKSLDTLGDYVRRGDLFREHAGAALL